MIDAMIDAFSPLLYITLRAQQLRGLNAKSGQVLDEPPVLAIQTRNGKRTVLAAGHAARQLLGQPEVELVNGFEHPRALLADFTLAENTLRPGPSPARRRCWSCTHRSTWKVG